MLRKKRGMMALATEFMMMVMLVRSFWSTVDQTAEHLLSDRDNDACSHNSYLYLFLLIHVHAAAIFNTKDTLYKEAYPFTYTSHTDFTVFFFAQETDSSNRNVTAYFAYAHIIFSASHQNYITPLNIDTYRRYDSTIYMDHFPYMFISQV